MKPKEAVDGLNYMISGGCTDSHWDFIDEIELAIEALEKQIPKKYMDTSDAHHGKCPVCGVTVYRNSYCWKCGQNIDWGD